MKSIARLPVIALALGATVLASVPSSATHRGAQKSCAALNHLDPDGDGSFSFIETMRRARHVFKSINNDGDRTLEPGETHGRISNSAFAAGNPDNDGSLDIFEWKRIARHLFNAANPDRDLSIECDELHSPAGKRLFKMLR